MKRANQPRQSNKLLVSVDRIRRLTSEDLRGAVGGRGPRSETIPCSHSVGTVV